jgi:hypothetical protein
MYPIIRGSSSPVNREVAPIARSFLRGLPDLRSTCDGAGHRNTGRFLTLYAALSTMLVTALVGATLGVTPPVP